MKNKIINTWPFIFIFLLLSLIIFNHFFELKDPFEILLLKQPLSPRFSHFFGTDILGRDIFSRVLLGGKFSLIIGFVSSIIIITSGTIIGIFSGYFKTFGIILNSMITLFMAFPYLLLSIAIASCLDANIFSIILALSISGWANIAKIIRSEVLTLKNEPFIMNLRGFGISHFRIIFFHILPNCLPIVLILFFSQFSVCVLAESSLSFIGLGLPPPFPSWGKMIFEGANYLRTAPWWSFFPGLFLTLCVLSLNRLGDFLREKYHVRIK